MTPQSIGRPGRNLVRHIANGYGELVAVRRVNADREPDWIALLIEGRSSDLEDGYPAIFGQLKKRCLARVRSTDANLVAVPDLAEPEFPPATTPSAA
jgi:hypothetical protein